VTITIPAVRITLADANTLRTALSKRSRTKSGVFANLTVNTAQLAGADASGFVQLYTRIRSRAVRRFRTTTQAPSETC
jgi:hypothetical protein